MKYVFVTMLCNNQNNIWWKYILQVPKNIFDKYYGKIFFEYECEAFHVLTNYYCHCSLINITEEQSDRFNFLKPFIIKKLQNF